MSKGKAMKTGEAAFPSGEKYYDGAGNLRGKNSLHEGMTLRDYFAAKAMQGFCTIEMYPSMENIARDAYALADAMLEARGIK